MPPELGRSRIVGSGARAFVGGLRRLGYVVGAGSGERLLDRRGPYGCGAHAGQPDTGRAYATVVPLHERGHPDYGPVLRPPSELLVRPAGVRAELGDSDLRHYLLSTEISKEVVLEELPGRDSPLPIGAFDDQGSFERGDHARHIPGGVTMRQGAPDGPPVLDRGIAQETRGITDNPAVLVDQLVVVYVAVPGQGADGQVVALVADVAQVLQAVQIDQDRGRGQPEPHERYERMPTSDEPCIIPVMAQELYSVVDRLGDLVVEGYRMHYASPPSCLTSAPRDSSEASACLSPACWPWAFWIAFQTRIGEAGMSMCVTPKGVSA